MFKVHFFSCQDSFNLFASVELWSVFRLGPNRDESRWYLMHLTGENQREQFVGLNWISIGTVKHVLCIPEAFDNLWLKNWVSQAAQRHWMVNNLGRMSRVSFVCYLYKHLMVFLDERGQVLVWRQENWKQPPCFVACSHHHLGCHNWTVF